MRLLLLHPDVARRSCDACERDWYQADGTLNTRSNAQGTARIPLPRPKGCPTPCDTCPKIPADEPIKARDRAVELSLRNHLALRHYLECKAVGFTEEERQDAVVRRNARIIMSVFDESERSSEWRVLGRLAAMTRMGQKSE